MKKRPVTTLFLLTSLDGKISTGSGDNMDVDKDFPKIKGLAEGLHQYYEIEQTTDLFSFNTGRVMQKIGVNACRETPEKMPVSFVILDNKPHLNENGIRYLCAKTKLLILVTNNKNHPALSLKINNLKTFLQVKTELKEMLETLGETYGVERLTIQSGGTLNELFLREKLIDYVDVVIAPVLVGGKDTPSLISGKSLTSSEQLGLLGVLKLNSCEVLENSYLRLRYQVVS